MNGLGLLARRLLASVALTFLMGMSHPARAQRPQTPSARASNFRISGTVVNARTGAPIPFAHLQATPVATGISGVAPVTRVQGAGRPGGPVGGITGFAGQGLRGTGAADLNSATADAHGQFTLTVSHAGGWRLTAQARGFRSQAVDEHDGFSSAVVLTDAAPTFSLTFRLLPSATVAGVVLDESGEPVERAQVSVELLPPKNDEGETRSTPRSAGFATTDDRGYYEVAGLAPGDYRVHAQATPWYAANQPLRVGSGGAGNASAGTALDPSLDFVYPPTWFPSATEENGAETLSLKPGDEVEADLRLTAVPAVHLQIPLPPATPAGADEPRQFNPNVVIQRIGGAGFDMGAGITSVNGQNVGESGGLAPGTYQIRTFNGRGQSFGRFGTSDDEDSDVREIEIRPGASGLMSLADAVPLMHVKLALEGTSAAPGLGVLFVDTATGRRVDSTAQIRFQRRGRPGQTGQDNDPETAKGTQTRTVLLRPGTYEVFLQSATDYLQSITATGAQVSGRRVRIGSETPTLTLHVKTGRATVAGIARSGGKPLAGAMVKLVPVTLGQSGVIDATYRDQSNMDGSFLMSSVLPGRYILIAIDHGWEIDWQDPAALGKYLEHGIPLDLQAGNKVEQALDAQLP